MLIWATMAAAQAVASDAMHPWASFSRASVMAGTSETAEIDTHGVAPGSRRLHLRIRLTWHHAGRPMVVQWADSRTCPAVLATVRAMRRLTVPRVTSPYDRPGAPIVVDGTGYTFDGPASGSNGRVAFSSNTGTPLAAWVDARLAALAPCWTKS